MGSTLKPGRRIGRAVSGLTTNPDRSNRFSTLHRAQLPVRAHVVFDAERSGLAGIAEIESAGLDEPRELRSAEAPRHDAASAGSASQITKNFGIQLQR